MGFAELAAITKVAFKLGTKISDLYANVYNNSRLKKVFEETGTFKAAVNVNNDYRLIFALESNPEVKTNVSGAETISVIGNFVDKLVDMYNDTNIRLKYQTKGSVKSSIPFNDKYCLHFAVVNMNFHPSIEAPKEETNE